MQEIDELFRIFRVLGTPTEATWPGVTQLPDYKAVFPRWAPRSLAELLPTLDPLGLNVLTQMLQCDFAVDVPAFQISCLPALAAAVSSGTGATLDPLRLDILTQMLQCVFATRISQPRALRLGFAADCASHCPQHTAVVRPFLCAKHDGSFVHLRIPGCSCLSQM